ncbi:unnamed protein product [Symbiodinium sp. CCMP2456]|nr:unnamed protein product [Symbiodinium sp. CCMP2456]
MRFWLLLTSFMVRAHRDSRESQHFAIQADEEIEEPAPTILASPENWSSVLGSIELEPLRVHLLPGVYSNVSFVLPPGATLELQGEPGTKVELLEVYGNDSDRTAESELMLKSLQLSQSLLEDLRYLILSLTDVALDQTGGSVAHFDAGCVRSLTIQRSVLISTKMDICGVNVAIVDSTIMFLIVQSKLTLKIANSTLANCSFHSHGNLSMVNSSMIGKYHLALGSHNRIQKSHFGACHGYCIQANALDATEESYFTMAGSSMQTAILCLGSGWRVEMHDMEVYDVHAPFFDLLPGFGSVIEGLPTLDLTFSMVKFRRVWSVVKIDANHWKLAMHGVTMEEVTLTGLSLQSRDENRRGLVQLRDVSMSNMLGVGMVMDQVIADISGMTCRECNVGVVAMDQVIADISGMTCRECNVGVVARGSTLNMSAVDMLGKHKQSNGIVLKSSHLEATDVRMTNLAAGLLLKSSTKMTCEMVSGLRSTAPSPEDSEDEEGHLGYQNVGLAERAAYEKDNIRASWFITQDDLVAGIKTQMQNVVASAEKRDQMKQGRVDLEGLFDPDPERQKGQNAAMDAKTGWALEEGKVMRTNSIAFQFANDYVRYHAYMALLPAAFRVCVENDYICKQSPMMRERIREPDMFDCCMSEDPETTNIFSSKSKLHAVGCNKCTPTSCFREQASDVGGGLLWAPSDPPVASKPNPVPKEFSDPHRWYMHGGPCSKYEYVTSAKFPGDRGHHQQRKTKYCQIVEDWSVTRSSEVQPGSLSGWLCGFDSDSEVDMSKNFQPNNALQSDLDKLVSRFTGYELNKTEGYATFGAMLQQDVVGPVRKPFAVAGGFSLEILRV